MGQVFQLLCTCFTSLHLNKIGKENTSASPKMSATKLLPIVLVIALALMLSTANGLSLDDVSLEIITGSSLMKGLETQFHKADLNKDGKLCVGEYKTFMTPQIIEYYKQTKSCTMEVSKNAFLLKICHVM